MPVKLRLWRQHAAPTQSEVTRVTTKGKTVWITARQAEYLLSLLEADKEDTMAEEEDADIVTRALIRKFKRCITGKGKG
jgi:hypothetical protein